MKTALIIHGMPTRDQYHAFEGPSESNAHWFPWLQHQMQLKGVLAQTPEMPEPYEPSYEKWKAVFEWFPVDEETILVGHSCGAGFLVRWLSETNRKIAKLALVGPWLDPLHTLTTGMFHFDITETVRESTTSIALFYSTDDGKEVIDSVKMLKEKIPGMSICEFTDHGHFTFEDMKTVEFPELRDFLLG